MYIESKTFFWLFKDHFFTECWLMDLWWMTVGGWLGFILRISTIRNKWVALRITIHIHGQTNK